MRAVCCDRCGKFAKARETDGWYALQPEGPTARNPLAENNEILLCAECNESFKNWLARLKSDA